MENIRQFVADTLALQGVSKASAANFAGVQPSALSHWLNGKPSISPEKLSQILSYIGLKQSAGNCLFRDNDELLSPRIWKAEDSVMDPAIRCLDRAREQYGEIRFALPGDIRGAAILFSHDGCWGAVQRCNPILLIGHRDTAASVGDGVIQRILDGDTKALIDSAKILALTGKIDLGALDVAHSIRETSPPRPALSPAQSDDQGAIELLTQWNRTVVAALQAGLDAATVQTLIQRFAALSAGERQAFLGKPRTKPRTPAPPPP